MSRLQWTFNVDKQGRWKIRNHNGRYLHLHEDVDKGGLRNSWIATGGDPMPEGWSVEVDRTDPDNAGVKFVFALHSLPSIISHICLRHQDLL